MSENEGKARYVSVRCGTPMGPLVNRPTIEYTGHGNLLCCDGWGGRLFRASKEWVQKGIDKFLKDYNECDGWFPYSNLYKNWGLEFYDLGIKFGYSSDETYKQDVQFEQTMYGPGSGLYEKFGEVVLLVEPRYDSMPWDGQDYMEE